MGRGGAGIAEPSGPQPGPPDLERIHAAYFGFVWRCLRGLGVPERTLDDAAQDVFVAVHRRLPEFRGESSLRTWLYGIVRNVAANQRRSERRKGPVAEPEAEQMCSRPGPHELAQDREAAAFVAEFLRGLSDAKRELFVLTMLEQLSVPEVAETLGIPLNTAYTRLRSARQEFARALERRRGKS